MSQLVKLNRAIFHQSLGFGKKPIQIFKNPIDFSILKKEKWAIVGDSNKTRFLETLSGSYLPAKPSQRTYPASLNDPHFNVELLKFVNNGSFGYGAQDKSGGFTHLSSRYEFFKDLEVDISVRDFITSKSQNSAAKVDNDKLGYLSHRLDLEGLEDKFITTLSNGQFRRARIAKVLYKDPALLLIDDPFLGLDPVSTERVSKVLNDINSTKQDPATVSIGLRIQDSIPDWVEKVAIVDSTGITHQGSKKALSDELAKLKDEFYSHHNAVKNQVSRQIDIKVPEDLQKELKDHKDDNIIEMNDVSVKYKGVPVIQGLNWVVKEGEKWHIRGRNGSGKTTLLSLITLDHPQAWKRNISVEGKAHFAGNVNYFDANEHIGFTSPELHAIFPRDLSVFNAISTGYIVGSYVPPKNLTTEQSKKITDYLKMVGLDKFKDSKFGDLSLSHQKLVLLLRALINDPRILILDESLSGMTDEDVIKGKCIVDRWNGGCCLIIGHVDEEVPQCDKYILMNQARNGVYKIGEVGKN